MNKFHKGGRGGDRRGGFKPGGRKDFGQRPMTMHQVVCSSCRKDCEVPFRPTGDRPVYCKDCFGGKSSFGAPRGNFGSAPERTNAPQGPGASVALTKQLEGVNERLDKLIATVEKLALAISDTKTVKAPKKAVVKRVAKKAAKKK